MQVEMAFQEAKADVTRYWIDFNNKPEWFVSQVNPAGKVRDNIFVALSFARVDLPRAKPGPSFSLRKSQIRPREPISRVGQDHRVARHTRVRRRPIPRLKLA